MTERRILEALPAVAKLNSFARASFEERAGKTDCKTAIYAMKHRLIRYAINLGMCKVRTVAVERPCKTCNGSGTYIWQDWNDEDHQEYETCRRCAVTPGKVILRFVETEIAGQRWHTPRPKADFLSHLQIDWEKCEATDWKPERPGKPLTGRELNVALNEAERAIFADKILRYKDGSRESAFDYSLHFGEIQECFVCGRFPARQHNWARRDAFVGDEFTGGYPNKREIHRPAMRWAQCICPPCETKADRWPRQWPANLWPHHDRGRWIDDLPRWTMNAPYPPEALSDVSQEWLHRRGICTGYPIPGDLCYVAGWSDTFFDLAAILGGDAFVKVRDYKHWAYVDRSDAGLFRVPASLLRSRNLKLVAGAVTV